MNENSLITIYKARAYMLGNEKLALLFNTSPAMAMEMCKHEWKGIKKLKDVRISIQYYGGGDEGDFDSASIILGGKTIESIDREDIEDLGEMFPHTEHDWWNNDGGGVEVVIIADTLEDEIIYTINYIASTTEVTSHQLEDHDTI